MQSLVRALRPAVSHGALLRAVAHCETSSSTGLSAPAAAVSVPFATISWGGCASSASGMIAVGGAWGILSPLWNGASGGCRTLTSSPAARGLEEFFDQQVDKDKGEVPSAGRGWMASELRQKSWDDLHKLWYVMLKERNMLQSEKMRAKSAGQRMLNPIRISKVRKSMARIKHVLNERIIRIREKDPAKAAELKVFLDAI